MSVERSGARERDQSAPSSCELTTALSRRYACGIACGAYHDVLSEGAGLLPRVCAALEQAR